MTVGELLQEAVDSGEHSLVLLIDFLLFKKAVTYDDDASKIDYYLQDRFRNKMNEYLSEHLEKNPWLWPEQEERHVFSVKTQEKRYFIAAQTKTQALGFFQREIGGEVLSIETYHQCEEVWELDEKEQPKKTTWSELLQRVEKAPCFLGHCDY
ncbi:hypothetical protein P9726_00500 [Geobacillus stearothermophilus]|uniref:hypothetical protein n=1 Tax=Geobacillus stearothermophilus TaxID=1422 RepID=UPI002E1D5604|nr:hypothetical protein [Geobacillus stearothermophilus]